MRIDLFFFFNLGFVWSHQWSWFCIIFVPFIFIVKFFWFLSMVFFYLVVGEREVTESFRYIFISIFKMRKLHWLCKWVVFYVWKGKLDWHWFGEEKARYWAKIVFFFLLIMIMIKEKKTPQKNVRSLVTNTQNQIFHTISLEEKNNEITEWIMWKIERKLGFFFLVFLYLFDRLFSK